MTNHLTIIDEALNAENSSSFQKRKSLKERLNEKLVIDSCKPSYDLIVTWCGLDADLNVHEKKEVFKWQPTTANEDSWHHLELKIVKATVEDGDDFRRNLEKIGFPASPYRWAYEFFDGCVKDFEIDLMSRVEIVVLKDYLSFVILDNHKYKTQKQCFWEVAGQSTENSSMKIDFLKFKEANKKSKFIRLKTLGQKMNAGKLFKTSTGLLHAWREEEPFTELFYALKEEKMLEEEKQYENDHPF